MGESEAKDLEVFDARLLRLVPFVSYVILHPLWIMSFLFQDNSLDLIG